MGYLDNAGLAHLWGKIKAALSGKQDILTGTAGQVVGFDARGQAVAQEAPEGGMTQAQADERYLKLTGGTMTGNLTISKTKRIIFAGRNEMWAPEDKKFQVYPTSEYRDSPSNTDFTVLSSDVGLSISNIVLNGMVYSNFNRIGYLGALTSDYDAVNKKYVDDAVAAVAFPAGGIIIWSGSVDTIPDGWALCNGSNGTPDLRNRFVLGAVGSYNIGATGGSKTVTLTVDQMPRHDHNETVADSSRNGLVVTAGYPSSEAIGSKGYAEIKADFGTASAVSITSTAQSGSSQPHENMPPYYTLCYIMKL